jgi:hypothetical protein
MNQTQAQPLPFRQREFTVSSPLLLSLYGIIPLCILLVGLDIAFFNGAIKAYLPSNPGALIWWAIIFNFPHIVSSLMTLADDEYIPYYKERFLKALKVIVVAVLAINIVLPMIVPAPVGMAVYGLFFIFFATYTMYHVLSQQFGIGMMMMKSRPGTPMYERWRRTATVAAASMYMLVFAKPNFQSVNFGSFTLYDVALYLAGIFVVISGLIGLSLTKDSKRQLGTFYVSSNVFMLVTTFIFAVLDYGVFVIAIPRFIHDLTALIIYSTHDHNRNREVKHNYIYRFFSFLPIPPLLLCVPLAILFATSVECGSYLLDFSLGFDPSQTSECALNHFYTPTVENPLPGSMQLGLQIMFICGFFHYYIEGFVWKREAIHRHSVPFS